MNFKKMVKFQKIGYSSIISFVYEGKDEIHNYMQYDVSMTVCMGRIQNQRKIPKWLSFKNYTSESIFNVHMRGTCVHMYTKYEVSTYNPVPGGGVHKCQC